MSNGIKTLLIILGVIALLAIGGIMYGIGEYNKAVALAETGQYEEALRFYDQCLAMNPGVSTVMTNRAVALARLGRYEEAEVEFREALALDPRDMTAWTNLGLCLSRLRREQEAIACFEKVRELAGVNTVRDILR